MEPFRTLFPKIAQKEQRVMTIKQQKGLPDDRYHFGEMCCIKPGCNCQSITISIFAESKQEHMATIEYNFAPSKKGKKGELVLLSDVPQSSYAPQFLSLCKTMLKDGYDKILKKHYRLVKKAIEQPTHPIHTILAKSREWSGACFSLPAFMKKGDDVVQPDLALWVDTTSGEILGQKIVSSNESSLDQMVALLQDILSKSEKNKAPARLRVSEKAQADALRKALGPKMEIDVGPLPEIDLLQQELEETFSSPEESASYLQEDEIKPASMKRLFRVLARLYRLRPWELLEDSQSPSVEIPSLNVKDATMTVMGQGEESFGFFLFSSSKDAKTFYQFAQDSLGGVLDDSGPGVSFLALEFISGGEIPQTMRKEISTHKWEVAGPQAYPEIRFTSAELFLQPYGEKEIELLTLCAEALCELVERHHKKLSSHRDFSIEDEFQSKEFAKKPLVRIICTETVDAKGDEFTLPKEAEELLNDFLTKQEEEGQEEEWLGLAEDVLENFLHFNFLKEGKARSFRAPAVEEFILNILPARYALAEDEIKKIPNIFGSFFSWLSQNKMLHPSSARVIKKLITTRKKEIFTALKDTNRAGPAKKLALLAEQHGVDLSDPEALTKFIEACNTGEIEAFDTLFDGFKDLLE